MSFHQHVFSVLVVSSAEGFSSAMSSLLPPSDYYPVRYATNVSAAKRLAAEGSFDFVIINSPLNDDAGLRFAVDCSTAHGAVVLLMVKSEVHEEVCDHVCEHGVYTLAKPISKSAMETALRWMATAKVHIGKYEKKTSSIEEKMKSIRLINKAKWLLISNEHLEEDAAHRLIEKEAMDRCITKQELAAEIIRKYSH